MSALCLKLSVRLPVCDGPTLLRWLAALLLAALPGAVLICILHCAVLPQAHAHHHHGPLLFYCHLGQGGTAEAEVPVSPALVTSLVQGMQSQAAPAMPGPALAGLLSGVAPAARFGRPADAPPAPPPRAPA